MTTGKQLLSFWPDAFAIVALVLPFTWSTSPLQGLFNGYFFLAAPAFLAIPIAAWQGLRVLRGMPTRTEQALAYALSTAAMLALVITTIRVVPDISYLLSGDRLFKDEDLVSFLILGLSWGVIAASLLLLRHNLKAAAPDEISAGVFLVGAYLPNAIFCLVGFYTGGPYYGWDIGAYIVLAACIGYILRITSLMRHGTKAYRPQENPSVGK